MGPDYPEGNDQGSGCSCAIGGFSLFSDQDTKPGFSDQQSKQDRCAAEQKEVYNKYDKRIRIWNLRKRDIYERGVKQI